VWEAGTKDDQRSDLAKWERALNGKAIRVLHSVNDGACGGESIICRDGERKELVHHYFTSAGFMTSGTMTVTGKRITAAETVSGSTKIAGVHSITGIPAHGTMIGKADFLDKDGKIVGERETTYREDGKAAVKFK